MILPLIFSADLIRLRELLYLDTIFYGVTQNAMPSKASASVLPAESISFWIYSLNIVSKWNLCLACKRSSARCEVPRSPPHHKWISRCAIEIFIAALQFYYSIIFKFDYESGILLAPSGIISAHSWDLMFDITEYYVVIQFWIQTFMKLRYLALKRMDYCASNEKCLKEYNQISGHLVFNENYYLSRLTR